MDKISVKKTLPEKMRLGNKKFQQCDLYSKDRMSLVSSQDPQVIVLGCSDSRVSLEIIFQSDLGELFPIRNAGHIVDQVTLGSIEYALQTFKAPTTLMVIGHQRCGAVTAAYESLLNNKIPKPHINALVLPIQAAIRKKNINIHEAERDIIIERIVKANVEYQADQLLHQSTIIAGVVKAGRINLILAVYDLISGSVEVLDTL